MMALQVQANNLTLTTPADVDVASEFLEIIKQSEKAITIRKEEITRPLMRSLASVRDLFKPMELTLTNAKAIVKAKMLAYQTLEEQKIEDAKAKLAARVDNGTMRVDTAIKKIEEVGTGTKMKTRTLTKVRIIDETIVPREYLEVNMTKITEAVLRQNVDIPGVEKYSEKIIAS